MQERPQDTTNPLEAELASIWADVLGTDCIGPDEDFFDLGGHSLLAIELRHRIRERFQAPFLDPDVLATPTISTMADEILRSVAVHLPVQPEEVLQ